MTSIITRIKFLFSRLLYLSFLLLIPFTYAETIELVANLNDTPRYVSPDPDDLTYYNGEVYFAYTDVDYGRELYSYNEATGKTRLVADIYPSGSSNPERLYVWNNKLYFYAKNKNINLSASTQLYEYDSATNKVKLSEHPLDVRKIDYDGFRRLDNVYYYWVRSLVGGNDLYSLDIDTNEVKFLVNIQLAYLEGIRLLKYDDKLILAFNQILYSYDENDGLITIYEDDYVCEDAPDCEINDVLNSFRVLNGKLYFTDGASLLSYDSAHKSVNRVTSQGCPAYTVHCFFGTLANYFGDKIFFLDSDGFADDRKNKIIVYDTTTSELYDLETGDKAFSECFGEERVYCYIYGTLEFFLIDFDNRDFTPLESQVQLEGGIIKVAFGNHVYFNENGGQLFVYNIEKNQVMQVTFAKEGRDQSSYPYNFQEVSNQLTFTAYDSLSKKRYAFDGDSEQLSVISDGDQQVTLNCTAHTLTEYNGKFYFIYYHELYGSELFYCDAPDNNLPTLAVDLNPGIESSIWPRNMVVYNNKLYFVANDGVHGQELYRYNDENNEAQLVVDLTKGADGSDIRLIDVVNEKLVFVEQVKKDEYRFVQYDSATEGVTFSKLWKGNVYNIKPNTTGLYFFAYSFIDTDGFRDSLEYYDVNSNTFTTITSRDGYLVRHGDGSWRAVEVLIGNVFIMGNHVFYNAVNDRNEYRLHYYDVILDRNVELGENAFGGLKYISIDNKLYVFHRYDGADESGVYAVNVDTDKIRPIETELNFWQDNLIGEEWLAYQGALYFAADDVYNGIELYRLLPNQAPIIEGENSLVCSERAESQLSSLTAFDADNDELTFFWQQTAGTLVDLDEATSDAPLFTTPNVSQDETLVFELTVSDGLDDAIQQVTVLVKANQPPTVGIANAGTVQTSYQEGEQFQLSALATDADNDVLTYQWQQLSGPSITLTNANEENVTITLPQVQANAVVEMQVTVFDGELSASAVVSFTINNVAEPAEKSSGGGAMQWLLVLLWIMAFRRTRLL